jgi:hypothetical protein
MKVLITALLAGLIAAPALAADSEVVVVEGVPITHPVDADEAALNACVEAFVNQILPNGAHRVRAVAAPGAEQVFTGRSTAPAMDVTMRANDARNGALLGRADCTVDRAAKVLNLQTKVPDQTKLAGLRPQDVKFTLASL